MASSTVPEYFNKYKTGAKFHVATFQWLSASAIAGLT
jgi:hypothetical protein